MTANHSSVAQVLTASWGGRAPLWAPYRPRSPHRRSAAPLRGRAPRRRGSCGLREVACRLARYRMDQTSRLEVWSPCRSRRACGLAPFLRRVGEAVLRERLDLKRVGLCAADLGRRRQTWARPPLSAATPDRTVRWPGWGTCTSSQSAQLHAR
jgi:hypothetical protein